jgi:DNA polymerase/3'-5' exonuclease PolX
MAISKSQIVQVLNTHLIDAHSKKEAFKTRAYRNAIESIKGYPKDTIASVDELSHIKGIGKSIKEKIQAIFDNPEKALHNCLDEASVRELTDIHGIGMTKALTLIKMGIKTIESLRKHVEKDHTILNSKQKLGLQYARDYIERIDRAEMVKHNNFLKRVAKKISEINDISIVGSYRRGATSSGDIDVIIEGDTNVGLLKKFVDKLNLMGYLHDESFAFGEQKYLGLAKLPSVDKYRRIDLLVTKENEYPFALLYFTGSKDFNVKLRASALKMGYSLNEHALTHLHNNTTVSGLTSEKDIIEFLGFKYIVPKKRC